MFEKIKNLIEIEQNMRAIEESISAQQQTMRSQSATLKKLDQQSLQTHSSLSQIEFKGSQALNAMQETLMHIQAIRIKLSEELADIKILKSTLKEKIVQEISSAVQSELALQLGRLRTDVQNYNDLKGRLGQLSSEIAQNMAEIQKFNEISKHIRATDFELTQHAKRLACADKEKLELIKRVDTLERMLSKERRRSSS